MIHKFNSPVTPEEYRRAEARFSYPRLHTDSTLVVPIGTMWAPGSWEKVVDMVRHTAAQGIECELEEVPSFSELDGAATIGYMQEMAVMKAINRGFDLACFAHNDVLPEPDTLLKLMDRQCAVVSPYLFDERLGAMIGYPKRQVGTGLQPVQWTTTSFMLMKTAIFNCPSLNFADVRYEDLFFHRLTYYGHQAWVDTDVEVKLAHPPGRPSRLSWNQRWRSIKATYQRAKRTPDRRSVDVNNRYMRDGTYLPPFTVKEPTCQ